MKLCEGYPTVAARDWDGRLAGFGLLHAHNLVLTFSLTAGITYSVATG